LDSSGYIARIIVDSSNSNRIFVAACGTLFTPNQQRGVFRSDDGGQTWSRKLFVNDSTAAIDIVQNPVNPNILYAAMWQRSRGLNYRRSYGDGSGIYYSADGGDNWSELTSGLPSGPGVGRIGLAIANSNPQVLYAFYDNSTGVEVYKTTNGGLSWVQVNDGPLQGMNSNFGWYFGQIRVDPDNEDRIFVLGVTLYKSEDGGSNWISVNNAIHVDHHAMYIDKNTGDIYEGNDGGLYFSDDYGDSWNKINNLPITQFYAIDVDNTFPYRIYGGTQDNGTVRTLNGTIGNWQHILSGDGMYCLVDYTNPDRIFAEMQWGSLYRSLDGGNSFSWIALQFNGDRKNWMSPYAMDPVNPDILYFGTYRIWKTLDGGDQWSAVSGDLTKGDDGSTYHTITTIDISPLDPDIVIAGTDDGRIHLSTDAGGSWTAIHSGIPDRWITRVATDPFNDSTLYATISGFRWDEPLSHVFRSTSLGQTWDDISLGLPEIPVNCIALDPLISGRIYIGSDAGVFYSDNGGQGWAGLSQGIPNVAITSLKIHNLSRKLVAGTYGCSTYSLSLDSIVGSLSLAGTVKYKNSVGSILNNVDVLLYDSVLNVIDSAKTDYNSYYSFFNVQPGIYNLSASSVSGWGGSNSTDALLAMHHFVGLDTLEALFLQAADTDGSGVVNSADALMIQKRFVSMIDSFPVDDWLFEKNVVTISSSTATTADFSGLCSGDPNASYIPQIAKEQSLQLERSGRIDVNEKEPISLPVMSDSDMNIGALSLVLRYDRQCCDVEEVVSCLSENNFIYNILDDEVRISWYNHPSVNISRGDTLFLVVMKKDHQNANKPFTMDARGEIVDGRAVPISDVVLYYPEIVQQENDSEIVSLFPNPASSFIHIRVDEKLDAPLFLELFDQSGRRIEQYHITNPSQYISLSGIESGLYFYQASLGSSILSSGKILIVRK